MSEFKGIEQAIKYAEKKSLYSVFSEAHRMDYLAGYNQALNDSCAPEMLEALQNIIKEFDMEIVKGIDSLRIKELIKKATCQ